jgi:hypothetical protein
MWRPRCFSTATRQHRSLLEYLRPDTHDLFAPAPRYTLAMWRNEHNEDPLGEKGAARADAPLQPVLDVRFNPTQPPALRGNKR